VLDHGLIASPEGQTPFYVMPLYKSSFRKLLDNRIDLDKRLKYFCQILDGVEAAHLQRVIHRDLKPQNILHDPTTNLLVVADFGIAHFTDEELYTSVETSPNARLANFLYAAPEQRRRGGTTDVRTDIYALGLMLNEMFTGDVPHGRDYKLIATEAPGYAWVDEIVAQMIQSDPTQRPQAVDAVKLLLLSNQQDYVIRQRLSDIRNTVVPMGDEDDPLAINGPRLCNFDWKNGTLTLIFDLNLHSGWIQGLYNMGNHSAVIGKEPRAFDILGTRAAIAATESEVPVIIDCFRGWIPRATLAYRHAREAERRSSAERERLRLRAEQDELEARQRLREKIRL
jgi:serine/threonine protein kinase